MNKTKWVVAISTLAIVGVWTSKNLIKKADSKGKTSIVKVDGTSYWTCPMHPQIHMDHSGECPICHMKLVKVEKQVQEQIAQNTEGDKRSSVQISSAQSNLIGIQRQEVEKMNLKASVPISGRILSSAQVALQIYEDDLRYIRPGLSFTGMTSTYSEDEIQGVISSVDSIADPTSRTVRVVGSIRKGPQRLIPETSFRGEIKIALQDRVAVPESSVLHTGTKDLVYQFGENNKLIPTPVKLGIKAEGFYEVLGGVNPGDIISSGPNFLIDSEAKIRGTND